MRRTIKATRRLPELTLAAGAIVIAATIPGGTPGESAAGVALVVVGAITRARRLAQQSISDTSRERDRLEAIIEENRTKNLQYVAAKAHLDREREEVCEQMAENERKTAARLAAERVIMRAKLEAEREHMLSEVENARSAIERKGYLVGLDHGSRGIIFEPTAPAAGAVIIQLPRSNAGSGATTAGSGGNPS